MNPPAPEKRRWPVAMLVVAVVVCVAAGALVVGWLYLPRLVSQRLPVDDIRQLGFDGFTGRITAIGPARTLAGPFVFGTEPRPAIFIGNVEIDYTPGGLYRKRIRRVQVSEVVINAEITPGGIVLPGFDPPSWSTDRPQPAKGSAPQTDTALSVAGVTLERLEIRRGQLNLHWGETRLRIPFSLTLTPAGDGAHRLDARLQLAVRDQVLTVNGDIDPAGPTARVRIDGPRVVLDAFGDLMHAVPGLGAGSGVVSLKADATLALSPFSISDIRADLDWHRGQVTLGGIDLTPADPATPARLSLAGQSLAAIDFNGGGISVLPLQIDTFTARVIRDAAGRKMTGSAILELPAAPSKPGFPLRLEKDIRLPLEISADLTADGTWQARLATAAATASTMSMVLTMDRTDIALSSAVPRFSVTANGRGAAGDIDGSVSLASVRGTAGGDLAAGVALPAVTGESRLQFSTAADGLSYSGRVTLHVPAFTADGVGVRGGLEDLMLTARIRSSTEGLPVVDARLHCGNGHIEHPESGVSLTGFELDLPAGLGVVPADGQGRFRIRRILKGKQTLGAVQGRLHWQNGAYRLTGTLSNPWLPGLQARFDGTVQAAGGHAGEGKVNIVLPAWTLPADVDWRAFSPAAGGMTLAGRIAGRATVAFSRCGLAGDMQATLADGRLEIPAHRITVDGLRVALNLPDLPRVQSAPAQQLRFKRAAMGDIVVDGGSIDFRVESPQTLFVEKGHLAWCGGTVDAGALRITAGKQDYALRLYCQRLGLSRILEQLGTVNARGTGTVNGRIPITYRDGKIRFDDGFLFSTPGEGGKIQLTGTDILTRGIPPDTPQFAQVELAREALKDYIYDWAKLGLSSEGETFVLRLQFDGKPARPLPFVYKKEIGGFVRVEAGGPGSTFQGIGLDVNLKLPLDRLLQYKDIVKMIQ